MACILMRGGGGPITGFEIMVFSLAVGAFMLVSISQAFIKRWIDRTRGRNWPTATAHVDIVSVADVTDDARLPSYLATLTYVYRNPEQQMGDYSRRFGNRDDATEWANSYKGETIKIHIDPRDSARSALREEDL